MPEARELLGGGTPNDIGYMSRSLEHWFDVQDYFTLRMWAAGCSLEQITEVMGSTPNKVKETISAWQANGGNPRTDKRVLGCIGQCSQHERQTERKLQRGRKSND